MPDFKQYFLAGENKLKFDAYTWIILTVHRKSA